MLRACVVVILLTIACVAPAHAARVWQDAVPVADPPPAFAWVSAASDGTTVAAWQGSDSGATLSARVDGHPPVVLGPSAYQKVYVAAGPGGDAVVAWATPLDGAPADRTMVAVARGDGSFSAPVEVGGGSPRGLVMNAAGDAALLMQKVIPTSIESQDLENSTAFRPAGGASARLRASPSASWRASRSPRRVRPSWA